MIAPVEIMRYLTKGFYLFICKLVNRFFSIHPIEIKSVALRRIVYENVSNRPDYHVVLDYRAAAHTPNNAARKSEQALVGDAHHHASVRALGLRNRTNDLDIVKIRNSVYARINFRFPVPNIYTTAYLIIIFRNFRV